MSYIKITPDDLPKIAQRYDELRATVGHGAVARLADEVGVHRVTMSGKLREARAAGLLQPESAHRPRAARFGNGRNAPWFACAECRHPWPCAEATSETTAAPDLDSARGRLFATVTEAASILEVDPRTIRHGIDSGAIPAIKVAGNTTRIPWVPFLRDVCGLNDQVLADLGLPGYSPGRVPEPMPEY